LTKAPKKKRKEKGKRRTVLGNEKSQIRKKEKGRLTIPF